MKQQLIIKIQENLTPDFLSPKYKKRLTKESHPFFGHCYVATEAMYYLYGIKMGYKPNVMRIDDNTTHWFLKKNNEIIDITKDQFDFELDYSLGRGCGFLTPLPSKRTKDLINKMWKILNY